MDPKTAIRVDRVLREPVGVMLIAKAAIWLIKDRIATVKGNRVPAYCGAADSGAAHRNSNRAVAQVCPRSVGADVIAADRVAARIAEADARPAVSGNQIPLHSVARRLRARRAIAVDIDPAD